MDAAHRGRGKKRLSREEPKANGRRSKGAYFFFAFFAVFFAFFAVFFAFFAAMVFFPFSAFADFFCFWFRSRADSAGLAFRVRDLRGCRLRRPAHPIAARRRS